MDIQSALQKALIPKEYWIMSNDPLNPSPDSSTNPSIYPIGFSFHLHSEDRQVGLSTYSPQEITEFLKAILAGKKPREVLPSLAESTVILLTEQIKRLLQELEIDYRYLLITATMTSLGIFLVHILIDINLTQVGRRERELNRILGRV